MALNQEYFDSIHIDTVKKKYYNANKVEAVLQDIRAQALALTEENAKMRESLNLLNAQRAEIGDAVLSANAVARQMISEARQKAEAIEAETAVKCRELEEQASKKCAMLEQESLEKCARLEENVRRHCEQLSAAADERQDYAVTHFERIYSRIKSMQEACIDALNEEWHSFLCGLYPEDAPSPVSKAKTAAETEANIKQNSEDNSEYGNPGAATDITVDLSRKIDAILKGINDINNDAL